MKINTLSHVDSTKLWNGGIAWSGKQRSKIVFKSLLMIILKISSIVSCWVIFVASELEILTLLWRRNTEILTKQSLDKTLSVVSRTNDAGQNFWWNREFVMILTTAVEVHRIISSKIEWRRERMLRNAVENFVRIYGCPAKNWTLHI